MTTATSRSTTWGSTPASRPRRRWAFAFISPAAASPRAEQRGAAARPRGRGRRRNPGRHGTADQDLSRSEPPGHGAPGQCAGSPFSVAPPDAGERGAGPQIRISNHTHLAESPDDDEYMRHLYGKASVYVAEDWGWVGDDVWYAHATVLATTKSIWWPAPVLRWPTVPTPTCTPRLALPGATFAPKGGHRWAWAWMAAPPTTPPICWRKCATPCCFSACALGLMPLPHPGAGTGDPRLGQIAAPGRYWGARPGMAADLIAVNLNKLAFAGGLHDPVAALVLCGSGQVDWSIVNGRIRVERGNWSGSICRRSSNVRMTWQRTWSGGPRNGQRSPERPRSGGAHSRRRLANERRSRYRVTTVLEDRSSVCREGSSG